MTILRPSLPQPIHLNIIHEGPNSPLHLNTPLPAHRIFIYFSNYQTLRHSPNFLSMPPTSRLLHPQPPTHLLLHLLTRPSANRFTHPSIIVPGPFHPPSTHPPSPADAPMPSPICPHIPTCTLTVRHVSVRVYHPPTCPSTSLTLQTRKFQGKIQR